MLTPEQRKAVNKIRAEKARAGLKKYSEEELYEIRSRAGKANSTKWTKGDERAVEAGKKSGQARQFRKRVRETLENEKNTQDNTSSKA